MKACTRFRCAQVLGLVRLASRKVAGKASAEGCHPVFIGLAPAQAARRYLDGVGYSTVRGAGDHHGNYVQHGGSAPLVRPVQARIWTVQTAGPGTRTLSWAVRSGDWAVVAMNADAARPVNVRVRLAATLPVLPELSAGLLITGLVLLGGSILLIAVPLRKGVVDHDH